MTKINVNTFFISCSIKLSTLINDFNAPGTITVQLLMVFLFLFQHSLNLNNTICFWMFVIILSSNIKDYSIKYQYNRLTLSAQRSAEI
jgi:hypothetical protein